MNLHNLLLISSLTLGTLASPAPARVQIRNTPTYTVTNGFNGIPPTAYPTSCTNLGPLGATRNDLLTLPCKNLTLIFARGTTESGNIGNIVGPPFVAALNAKLGSAQVSIQGVNNYAADIAGFDEGGSPSGSQNMAQLIALVHTKCPKTKLCVSGYSQGAQVAHNAAGMITAGQTGFVNSVVLFGDPDEGEAFGRVSARRVSTDCHLGDDICLHGDLILPPHLDYCLDVEREADFVVGLSGLKTV